VLKGELSSARPSCSPAKFDSRLQARRVRLRVPSACLRPRQRGNRDAFRRLDFRPCVLNQACTRSLFARSRSPRTRSPTANRLTSSGTSRRVRLPCRSSAHLAVRFALPGKMRLTNFCNRRYDTSTLWIARFPNHLHRRLSPRNEGFHGRPPGRNLNDDVTSGRASLDGEPLALAWPSMSLAFAWNQRHPDL